MARTGRPKKKPSELLTGTIAVKVLPEVAMSFNSTSAGGGPALIREFVSKASEALKNGENGVYISFTDMDKYITLPPGGNGEVK